MMEETEESALSPPGSMYEESSESVPLLRLHVCSKNDACAQNPGTPPELMSRVD